MRDPGSATRSALRVWLVVSAAAACACSSSTYLRDPVESFTGAGGGSPVLENGGSGGDGVGGPAGSGGGRAGLEAGSGGTANTGGEAGAAIPSGGVPGREGTSTGGMAAIGGAGGGAPVRGEGGGAAGSVAIAGSGGSAGMGPAGATGSGSASGGATGQGGQGGGQGGMGMVTARVDTAQYNFETSTQGWTMSPGAGVFTSIARSTALRFAGMSSLEGVLTTVGNETFQLLITPSGIAPGTIVTFHLYFPTNASVDWVMPYVQQGAASVPTAYLWTGAYTPAVDFVLGVWNTIPVQLPIPATAVFGLGVQFHTAGAWTGSVYVDSVGW